ncbi:hypothetical protein BCR44DRAFT_1435053 [Catenaria anguillulae PL171]|uniref:Uncharacterized protein n=1 Tax=Catenaria anguillulae PL171 TaxID=765915 RepID=A0A1Y2HKI3_9FUNG|nr:hypothetical protein BCR44DRAFT_1435053 [Catenaria anguillulae PL171]
MRLSQPIRNVSWQRRSRLGERLRRKFRQGRSWACAALGGVGALCHDIHWFPG